MKERKFSTWKGLVLRKYQAWITNITFNEFTSFFTDTYRIHWVFFQPMLNFSTVWWHIRKKSSRKSRKLLSYNRIIIIYLLIFIKRCIWTIKLITITDILRISFFRLLLSIIPFLNNHFCNSAHCWELVVTQR